MSFTALAVVNTLIVATAVILLTIYARGLSSSSSDDSNSTEVSWIDPEGPSVQFILFTRDYPPRNLKVGTHAEFIKTPFNISIPTKIIVHGFLSGIRESIFQINRDAYLSTGEYNIVGMDWSVLCEFEYLSAMRGSQIAGEALGAFINWIIREGVLHEHVHLIGHSLGAHVAGMGASHVKGGKISRISGLDPAGPGYRDVPEQLRLDPNDAVLVEVIHTFIRVLSLPHPQGHIDFYPNGGKFQPGCPDMYDIFTIGDAMECNHARAYWYFAESIRNKRAFRATRCLSVNDAIRKRCRQQTNVYMGQAETYENGVYFLQTNDKPPFSLS